ncbi:MAG: (Fe-S)-binding protein [Polyangiaceae bacterium]|nr:(Fe-S)-binding protein [Polyangiaceae bacterium]
MDHRPPPGSWTTSQLPAFRLGSVLHPAKPRHFESLGLPNGHAWSPLDEDWKLPEGWQDRVLEGMRERIGQSRALRLFMDTCVRCGACAEKCPAFIGSGDPKNMPVLRAELLRSVYRKHSTLSGRLLGELAGARELTADVVKEWFKYFFQCTECRRCAVFCPYGIDTAEITMLARDLLLRIGLCANWVLEPVANCYRTGNHLGIQPHGFKAGVEFLADELEAVTGVRVDPPINRKGAEILFVTPSGDLVADPGTYTFMGYLALFHELGLDYTLSTYASEGGNFGLFASPELMKRLNAKMYAEARRLGVKWILGGECGHMWRVVNQYMDTMNGPADFLELPVSPVTGTRFTQARSTKMVHIAEFTADLLAHGRLRVDPKRNAGVSATFHDSCNTARGMGLLEEPRAILRAVCSEFHEMPEDTIRERTLCCGGGAGLGADENMELRLRAGMPRGKAVCQVRDAYGVNCLVAMCAIDRATLPTVCDYWAKGVRVAGLHELVGNALIMKGEKPRTLNLRREPLVGVE